MGTHVAIATSAGDREMTALLRHAGVGHLISTGTPESDADQSKPDSDAIAAVLHQAHARPESTVMVGDTPYDVEAARRVGVQSIALRSGGFWSDAALSDALHIFDDPSGLLKYWQRAG
jgi:phosphoglycolate phosphatase-like HAD superfamily hydrolase